MKAKKLLALLMSLVLLLGALAVPALAADDGTTDGSAAAGSSEAASEAASDAAAAAQEAYTKIMLDAASKKYDGDTVVATVNGTEVTWKLCYYLIASMTSQFIRYTMAIPDFTTDTGDGTTLQDAMREALEARMKYYTVPAAEADKRGLAETVDAEVETQWNSIVEQYGGVDALMEAMESAYLDEPTSSGATPRSTPSWRIPTARTARSSPRRTSSRGRTTTTMSAASISSSSRRMTTAPT